MKRDLAKAIAIRQEQIDKLQAEIDALGLAGNILNPGRKAQKRSPSAKSVARKKRRKMTPSEKKAVSKRMRAYWAKNKKKTSK